MSMLKHIGEISCAHARSLGVGSCLCQVMDFLKITLIIMMSVMNIGLFLMMRQSRLMQISPYVGNKQIVVLVYCHNWNPCLLPWTSYFRSKTRFGLRCRNLASLFLWWRKPGSYMPWKNISCAMWNYLLVLLIALAFRLIQTVCFSPSANISMILAQLLVFFGLCQPYCKCAIVLVI